MGMVEIRIGIIGTGRIAERFWDECLCVAGVRVKAIYNRHIESVRWFAEKKQILDEEDILLTDDIEAFYEAIDGVYVASPHEYHVAYILQALEHNKHVLCEKPMSVSRAEAEKIFDLAQEKHLVCMEAIKTAYCPGFAEILRLVLDGAVGTVRDIDATFTKIGTAAGREMWSEYGGSFVELASYVLLPVMKIYGVKGEKPQIHTFSLEGAPHHDSYTKMMLTYHNHVATVKTGLGVKSEGELIISGDRGYIRVPSPWWLTKHIEVHHEDPNQVEIYEKPFEGAGLRYEIDRFVKSVDGNKSNRGSYFSISAEESIWLAEILEMFRMGQAGKEEKSLKIEECDYNKDDIKIWAHRGCSMKYPENTLLSFKKAAEIRGIAGIELDVQLTSDGEVVVIHDEQVNRTTDGCGRVCDFSLEELRSLHITGAGQKDMYALEAEDREFLKMENSGHLMVPTFEEVLELLKPYCEKDNLRINVELKNSAISYEGMEQKVIALVRKYGLDEYVVYSSFNEHSLRVVQRLEPKAEVAILAQDYHKCLDSFYLYDLNGIHPGNQGMPVNAEDVYKLHAMGIPVRMYNGVEPLYGQSKRLPDMDLREYWQLGATDIFTNVPERYLDKMLSLNDSF